MHTEVLLTCAKYRFRMKVSQLSVGIRMENHLAKIVYAYILNHTRKLAVGRWWLSGLPLWASVIESADV